MRQSQSNEPVQGTLFDRPAPSRDRHTVTNAGASPDPSRLSDREVLEGIPGANLARAEALCEQVISRGLGDAAVPALGELWDRFRGFGIDRPCSEQLAVLSALSRIGTKQSGILVKRIAEDPGLPTALLPQALKAALACRVRFTPQRIAVWVESEQPAVRALAFSLAQWVSPPWRILEMGRSDPDQTVRNAALITMGKLGLNAARAGLLTLLDRIPNADIVRALATIADDEVITLLGRCAEEHEALRSVILEELKEMDNCKAQKIADRMERQRD